jgi:hypothetical protein
MEEVVPPSACRRSWRPRATASPSVDADPESCSYRLWGRGPPERPLAIASLATGSPSCFLLTRCYNRDPSGSLLMSRPGTRLTF